ncbi:MAG: hypothetical protein IJK20_00605 [Bacteroidales bacterium]|nr:hypothetical protein [Bacteroidales bacterium]
MQRKYIKYLVPIAIASIAIIVLLLCNEWVSFHHCKLYNSYSREMTFLTKYPDSKYRAEVCQLIQKHEKEYVNEAFDNFRPLTYTSEIMTEKYESAYKQYVSLFPNGELKDKVAEYVSRSREECDFRKIKDTAQPSDQMLSDFLSKYPDSKHASEVRNIKATAIFRNNSLENGSQPYAQYYGYNDRYGGSAVEIKSSSNHDCVVTVKYNNVNGNVAGHVYVRRGQTAVITLPPNNKYQVFFYSGLGWYPDKEMPKGIRGGFLTDESYSCDATPFTLEYGESMTYTLTPVRNGNFKPSTTNSENFF